MTRFSASKISYWPILLLFSILQGCGGGSSDSSENIVQDSSPPPQDGIRGRVASKVENGKLTVTDANGEEIVIASGNMTNANGAYHLIFSEFEIAEGINAPLTVTVDGNGATAVCDYDGESDNDCLTASGSFVSYGERYELPAGFIMRGIASTFPPDETFGDRTITVNLSAASDLAARYASDAAAGTPLTEEIVTLAQRQALGLVEFITGLAVGSAGMNTIGLADLNAPSETPSSTSLAVSLMNASLHGQVNTEDGGIANYRLVLNRMGNRIRPETGETRLQASSADLALALTSYLATAKGYQATLAAPLPILNGAISAQTVAETLLTQAGSAPVAIALPADPASSDPLDQSKIFAASLSEVIGATLLNSQTAAFGGTAAGAATVYLEQAVLINALASAEVRSSLLQLDAAMTSAIAAGATELTGTNVSGLVSADAGNGALTSGTSTVSNIQSGISVNLTTPEATRTAIGEDGTFELTGVTVAISQTQNNLTVQVLYEGTLTLTLKDLGEGLQITASNFEGTLQAVSGLQFEGSIAITAPTDTSIASGVGVFDASFSFQDTSQLTLAGDLAIGFSSSTISAGNSTIFVDHETNIITDMTSDLNLIVDEGGTVTGGTLTSGEVETGTIDSQGVIYFTDDTVRALPAPVI